MRSDGGALIPSIRWESNSPDSNLREVFKAHQSWFSNKQEGIRDSVCGKVVFTYGDLESEAVLLR